MHSGENTETKGATSNLNKSIKDLEISRKDFNVNKILGYLHPEDTKTKH